MAVAKATASKPSTTTRRAASVKPSAPKPSTTAKSATPKVAPSTASPARQLTPLQVEARAEFDRVRLAAFRALAKDHGGVNPTNRAAIEAQANAAAQYAARTVYIAKGYSECPGANCDRLVTPGYRACPRCS